MNREFESKVGSGDENAAPHAGAPVAVSFAVSAAGRDPLSAGVAARICERLARGISLRWACEAEGVDEADFRRRVIEARQGEFRGLYARARVEFEERLIERLLSEKLAGRGEIFILERKFGWARESEEQLPTHDVPRKDQIRISDALFAELQKVARERFGAPDQPTPI